MKELSNNVGRRQNSNTQGIAITLTHNAATRDWTVAINNQRHEHVTFAVAEALVECEMIIAETSLTDEHNYGPDATVSLSMFRRQ
jgi:3-dehydroquinate dehydratase